MWFEVCFCFSIGLFFYILSLILWVPSWTFFFCFNDLFNLLSVEFFFWLIFLLFTTFSGTFFGSGNFVFFFLFSFLVFSHLHNILSFWFSFIYFTRASLSSNFRFICLLLTCSLISHIQIFFSYFFYPSLLSISNIVYIFLVRVGINRGCVDPFINWLSVRLISEPICFALFFIFVSSIKLHIKQQKSIQNITKIVMLVIDLTSW